MSSRQYRWAEKKRSEGNCRVCGKKAVNAQHCEEHRLQVREKNRNRYREKVGIPFNAPLSKRGRPIQ